MRCRQRGGARRRPTQRRSPASRSSSRKSGTRGSVRFWDSSAIVPLVCREAQSPLCRKWLRSDSVVLVWALAATEVASALARKRRDGALAPRLFLEAKRRLAKLETAWHEVA